MYELFFEDRSIIFTSSPEACGSVFEPAPGERVSITKMLEKFGTDNTLELKTENPREDFLRFCSLFEPVDAGGGVVRDERERVLIIDRNGRADLPKGHLERGETPSEGAVREVSEETGLTALACGELLSATYHFYPYGTHWRLKRTWWFDMRSTCGDAVGLRPQVEEGITGVKWVEPDALNDYVATAFASVRRVLQLLKTKN